jgi:hypothetical protein
LLAYPSRTLPGSIPALPPPGAAPEMEIQILKIHLHLFSGRPGTRSRNRAPGAWRRRSAGGKWYFEGNAGILLLCRRHSHCSCSAPPAKVKHKDKGGPRGTGACSGTAPRARDPVRTQPAAESQIKRGKERRLHPPPPPPPATCPPWHELHDRRKPKTNMMCLFRSVATLPRNTSPGQDPEEHGPSKR